MGSWPSLQANVNTLQGAKHPDRDAQFRYLKQQVKDHRADGEPVISVDTNKRSPLGRLPMAGRQWRPKGEPVEVEDHHFFFGVFHQKISNRERVLLAVLYQRRLCTMDVLAELLEVCRSSIGNAIRETLER